MAKKSKFGADTVLEKHMGQSALVAHGGGGYFIPKGEFYDESLSPRFDVCNCIKLNLWTMPTDDGDDGDVLTTDGGGGLSFETPDVIVDEKVGVDSEATPDYLGTASDGGVLRTTAPLTYADGGNYITLSWSHLGIQSLTNPGADRIMIWDNSAVAVAWLQLADELSISDAPLLSVNHNLCTNYVADEHIDWTGASDDFITSGYVRGGYDTDTLCYFGRAAVGSVVGYTDFAMFRHLDVADQGYALLQQTDGNTFLNAATSKIIRFRINNADRATMDATEWKHVGEAYKLNQTTNPLNAIIWNTSITDLASGMTESTTYADLDLTSYSSANAKGVVINVTWTRNVNDNTHCNCEVLFRKNGSSVAYHAKVEACWDNRSGSSSNFYASAQVFVPCDAGQIIEWKIEPTVATHIDEFYVVGYWE